MPEKQTVNLGFQLIADQFPHAWFFNRFRVDVIGNSRLVTLGLSSETGGILAVNGVVLTGDDLDHNRDRALEYLQKLADVATEPFALLALSIPPARVYPVNHMSLARVNQMAEIGFFRYSVNTLVEAMKEARGKPLSKTTTVPCYPIVMFRSDLAVQVTLLKELYSG